MKRLWLLLLASLLLGPDETPEGHLRAKYIDPTVFPDRPPIAIKNKHKTI
jgi:hypothetical protein